MVFPRALSWDRPILFIMYTTPLSSLISQTSACHEPQVDHHLYADDTQLFISFSPHAAHAALDSLHATLAAISQWMASNFLTLNPSKTEFLITGLPTQLSKLHMPNLILPDNSSITPVESARNLGIIFDSNLSFAITYLIFQKLATIISVTSDASAKPWTLTLHVPSQHLWFILSLTTATLSTTVTKQMKRLQVIQNSLARYVISSSRF